MLSDPDMKRGKVIWRVAVGGGRLGFERRAELRLPAGAIEKDDEMSRDLHRDLSPKVFLHHRKAEIDSGGDPGRSPNPVITHIDWIGVYTDVGVALLQRAA